MAVDTYIDDILNSPTYVFDEIIDKLIAKNIQNAKIEQKRYATDIDTILFEAIKSILKDLREEEGFISRFLYSNFGIELRKNKRRAQLIFLGSQLKTQYSKIKAERFRIYRQTERISLSIVDLKRLSDGFGRKNIYFQTEKNINKSKFFIKEIENNIESLKECQLSLESKYGNLGETEKLYSKLLKKIPRYHELHEENYLLLEAPSRKRKK
jgi:ribosomal protein S8